MIHRVFFYLNWVCYPGRKDCLLEDAYIHQLCHLCIDFLDYITHFPPLFSLDGGAPQKNIRDVLNDLAVDSYHVLWFPCENLRMVLQQGN